MKKVPSVLVVDDEDDFRETLSTRLRRRGLSVREAESGQRCLDLLDEELFDVAILDVKMPGMDGIEVLEKIKQRKPSLEVILLTGHGSVEAGIEGMKLGAFDYVMKPTNIDDLFHKVHQAYERKGIFEGPTE
jgi:two-component system OmpR family response regulator